MPRSLRFVPLLFACHLLLGCEATEAHGASAHDPDTQIHWERSLDDALAVALRDRRPILLAVNMDGESASDRIVNEQYRDPAFVAASRNYVCVVASLFRHNPRDFDDQGRRIPCPRLGCITCGEHIVNEPAMFKQLLADGERVAPRHAVIAPDGKKAWDLSLNFDLTDIDRALIATSQPSPLQFPLRASDWTDLAKQRSDRGRVLLEQAIAAVDDEAELGAALDALATHGGAGSIDALRLVAARLPSLSNALQQRFVATVATLQLGEPMATVLREQIETLSPQACTFGFRFGSCGTAEIHEGQVRLSLLEQIDGQSDATRSYLLARKASDTAFSLEGDGPYLAATVWSAVRQLRPTGTAPAPDPFTVEMPTAEALEAELDSLDRQLRDNRDDVELRARLAKASLDLARRRIEAAGKDVALLLADAENYYGKILDQQPERADWWIERARCAYFRSEFAAEVEFARAALRAASGKTLGELDPAVQLDDAATVEALRWLADGGMRLYPKQVAGDPAAAAKTMGESLRAFAFVAMSTFADDNDWTSFASSCGAMGLWTLQFEAAQVGALRVPSGSSIRQCLNQALWACGRADQVAAAADAITVELTRVLGEDHHERGASLWFAGYAWMLRAEDHRRGERMADAVAAYATARERFAAAAAARPDYAGSCTHYAALCWLGSGLAEVRAGHRQAAADCLVEAVTKHADLAGATDGLGYDVLDLVDKIGEWRASGPSDVDPQQLLARLDTIAPDTAFYAVAIADSQLREALRADGRNEQRQMRTTVDAAGEPIRMLMGLPNDEGDGYLRASIAVLRAAKERLVSDDAKVALAQADTVWAERNLERNRADGVAQALREAAELLSLDVPAADADTAALQRTAAALRKQLGEARPRWRMGR